MKVVVTPFFKFQQWYTVSVAPYVEMILWEMNRKFCYQLDEVKNRLNTLMNWEEKKIKENLKTATEVAREWAGVVMKKS